MSIFTLIAENDMFKDYVDITEIETFWHYVVHVFVKDDTDDEFAADPVHIREKAMQKEIEEKLARYLKDVLDQYVRGDKEGFLQRAESEARRLTHEAEKIQIFGNQNSIGVDVLHTIGWVYSRQAAQELGRKVLFGVPFLVERVRNELHLSWTRSAAREAAFVELPRLDEKFRKQYNQPMRTDSVPRLEQNAFLNMCWKLDAFDIEVTLVHVCQMVLGENSARATALKILGDKFQSHTSSSCSRVDDTDIHASSSWTRVDDTDINRGRPFYTCSINKDEFGYCDNGQSTLRRRKMTRN